MMSSSGSGDQCFINTSGIGVIEHPRLLSADQARPGDRVILSGTIGDHGMAVMSRREGLEFDTVIESDTYRRLKIGEHSTSGSVPPPTAPGSTRSAASPASPWSCSTWNSSRRPQAARCTKLKAKADKEIAEAKKEYFEHLEELRDDIESQVRKWGPDGEGLKDLRAKIETELQAWGPQIHSLQVAAEKAETDAKRLIEDVKAKKKALKARLAGVKQAGDSASRPIVGTKAGPKFRG